MRTPYRKRRTDLIELVRGAHQKTSGVESVFELNYEIDGEQRPACGPP